MNDVKLTQNTITKTPHTALHKHDWMCMCVYLSEHCNTQKILILFYFWSHFLKFIITLFFCYSANNCSEAFCAEIVKMFFHAYVCHIQSFMWITIPSFFCNVYYQCSCSLQTTETKTLGTFRILGVFHLALKKTCFESLVGHLNAATFQSQLLFVWKKVQKTVQRQYYMDSVF